MTQELFIEVITLMVPFEIDRAIQVIEIESFIVQIFG